MSDFFRETVFSGSLIVALPVALLAGLISFFSPCCLPLLPGYLSYATGLSGADLAEGNGGIARRGRLLLGSVLFVLGFVAVFVTLGATVGALGEMGLTLLANRAAITFWLGFFVIAMGLLFAGLIPGMGFLNRDWRIHSMPAVGLAAAPVIGFLFGLGWSPCIGPTLVSITALSLNEATAGRGALLSGVFGLGLGLPFIAAGLFYERALVAFGFVRRHQRLVMRIGGLMLVLVGLAMVLGWYDYAVQWLQVRLIGQFETVA
ncbi:cytochrome c biogenesis CcdA family protein [Nocardioides cavernaquae]|uniref:Cytochrome c biogenesis protein CcdA n=1 Tax=Nocardioides cavernaquae TaxID=2321396 RepID=A0A3A5HCL1_9ACTN|nr:cytochrome c biogenesis protein CcdA [Nocardioides cavernaquae]RJS47841.1 cytochrome c biogenesis protein CcdA [Nocardioides cavernaquae]